MDNHTIEIRMNQTMSTVKLRHSGGGLVSKEIPTYELIPMINRALPSTDTTSIELLPQNIRVNCKQGDMYLLGFMQPERIGDFTWYRDPEYDSDEDEEDDWATWKVKYPYSMTFVRLDKQSSTAYFPSKYWQFALKNPLISLDDMMYRWPGPNVYNDYSCCMGDNQNAFNSVPSIFAAGTLQYQFINGINNNDLSENCFIPFAHQGIRVSNPLTLFYKVLKVEDGAAPPIFPYECLRNAMSVSNFLSGIGFSS